jgi:hypothetical protein
MENRLVAARPSGINRRRMIGVAFEGCACRAAFGAGVAAALDEGFARGRELAGR